jgi:hypothetical protein
MTDQELRSVLLKQTSPEAIAATRNLIRMMCDSIRKDATEFAKEYAKRQQDAIQYRIDMGVASFEEQCQQ